jgi:pimeloyl-ACP methyl ester carboxylesterase
MFAEARLSSGLTISYQVFGEGAPLLLIMGLGAQMLLWPDPFCEALAARGYQVIRFDNRDVGGSTRLDWAPPIHLADVLLAVAGRRRTKAPYLLADMADDAWGLLDHLGLHRVHVVGASMGGMIAQTMAIGRPDRVLSLTSIMSTTGSRRVGLPSPKGLSALLRRPAPGEQGAVDFLVHVLESTGSPAYPVARADVELIAKRCFQRGATGAGFLRQLMAVVSSGDRTIALRNLRVPTLVIHGEEDPLVGITGGEATASAVPGAVFHRIAGMGHDLPPQLWPRMIDAIDAVATQAPSLVTRAT